MKLERAFEVGVLILAVSVGVLWVVQRAPSATPELLQTEPLAWNEVSQRREVVLVYLGDLSCSFCTDPAFKATIKTLLVEFRADLERKGSTLYPIGVVVSGDAEAAVEYLQELGTWSEYSIGGGWANSFPSEFVWGRGRTALTPQLFLFERDIVLSGPLMLISRVGRIHEVRGAANISYVVEHENWSQLLPVSPP